MTEVYSIFIRERNVSHIVTTSNDSGNGSLREAIGLAGNNDFIVFDFPVDDFPVPIPGRLDEKLVRDILSRIWETDDNDGFKDRCMELIVEALEEKD